MVMRSIKITLACILFASCTVAPAISSIGTEAATRRPGMAFQSVVGYLRSEKGDSRVLPISRSQRPRFGLRMAISEEGRQRSVEKEMVKDFLTQRTIQTHLKSMESVGDKATFEFLEQFGDHHGLSTVHYYGALNKKWKDYFLELQTQPDVTIERTRKLFTGGSRNNPYLQDNTETYVEEVSPRQLAMVLLEWRSEIADEWEQDLELIPQENAEIWRHHLAMVQNASDPEASNRYSLLQPNDDSTPLRLASYDLLDRFCTHVAADKILAEISKTTGEERTAIWLKEFVSDQGIGSYRGQASKSTWGLGRSFLRNIINEPPKVIAADGEMKLLDPLDIAARIMAERQVLSEVWITAMQEVKDDHLDLHRTFMESCFADFLTFGNFNES